MLPDAAFFNEMIKQKSDARRSVILKLATRNMDAGIKTNRRNACFSLRLDNLLQAQTAEGKKCKFSSIDLFINRFRKFKEKIGDENIFFFQVSKDLGIYCIILGVRE